MLATAGAKQSDHWENLSPAPHCYSKQGDNNAIQGHPCGGWPLDEEDIKESGREGGLDVTDDDRHWCCCSFAY